MCLSRSKFPTPTKNGRSTLRSGSTPKLGSGSAEDNAEKLATEFVLKTLKKRLFSSPAAFLTTLDQHEKSLRQAKRGKANPPSRRLASLKQELDRIDEDYADDTNTTKPRPTPWMPHRCCSANRLQMKWPC